MTFPITRQGMQDIALLLIAGGVLFAVLAFIAYRRRRSWRRFGMSAGFVAALVAADYGIAFTIAPNIPSPPVPFTARFAQNPTPDTDATIAAGRTIYQTNCAVCHGSRALGDGPAAFTLSPRPANLQLHMPLHAQGESFWWMSEGVPGTGMPAWKEKFGETELWQVVRYLQALASKRVTQ